MRYALLICVDEKWMLSQSESAGAEILAGYGAWMQEMTERGVLQGGERLRPTSDATTVRVRDGEVITADGPFAETKEQVGGFFIVDAKDLDDATDIASRLPAALHGTIEVRPIWEM
ncbi:MAG: YciI family protein [Acidimicrobiales bacterium]|nr:YciI family protein [Acidimicrobiales bacterium]